jgi:hypothetical protein
MESPHPEAFSEVHAEVFCPRHFDLYVRFFLSKKSDDIYTVSSASDPICKALHSWAEKFLAGSFQAKCSRQAKVRRGILGDAGTQSN